MGNDINKILGKFDLQFLEFQEQLTSYVKELEAEINNLRTSNEELSNKYSNLNDEYIEYRNKYNEESLKRAIEQNTLEIQKRLSSKIDELKSYTWDKKSSIDSNVIYQLNEILTNEIKDRRDNLKESNLLQLILKYLYSNNYLDVLKEILETNYLDINMIVLELSNEVDNSNFAIELLKYYILFLNRAVSKDWLNIMLDENIVGNIQIDNESYLIDLLFCGLELQLDKQLFKEIPQMQVVVKSRKYDYCWYELYNKCIVDREKIQGKLPLLKLYLSGMNLIDYNLKNCIVYRKMEEIQTIKDELSESINNMNKKRIKFISNIEFELNNNGKEAALTYLTKNADILKEEFSEVHNYKLLLLSSILGNSKLFIEHNKFIKDILKKDIPEVELFNILEKEQSLKNGTILDEISNDFLETNKDKFNIISKEFQAQISSHLPKEIVNADIEGSYNKTKQTNKCPKHYITMKESEGFIYFTENNKKKYLYTNLYYCTVCNKYYCSKEDKDIISSSQLLVNDINGSSDKAYSEEVELNVQSELGKLGYSTSKSDVARWNILTEKALPEIGKTKVIKHIEWLIKFHKNKKNAVLKWQYDLQRLRNLK